MNTRRRFLAASAALTTASLLPAADAKKPKLRKAVKYSMIAAGKTVRDKFEVAKRLGFEGVEMDSPSGVNRYAALKAQDATGIKVHGVIDSMHWTFPLSSPDAGVREEGLAGLETALHDAKLFGSDTVLLVPGVVTDKVTYEQCWERSTAEVKKVLPLAERLKIKIAFETVWNNFITKPEQLVEYVDQFKSDWAAAYLDVGNVVRYSPPAEWARTLGKRTVKVDVKGYNGDKAKEANDPGKGWCKIGEGTEDWPEVLKALAEVGYDGWATAEVSGGDEKVLADIAERMDRVLGLR
jgi:L-ribulose-5-phosphate 3-epimerase